MIKKFKMICRGVIAFSIYKLLAKQVFDKHRTISIFGAPRSGSTWLAELFSNLNGNLQIFEPLHPEYNSNLKKLFRFNNYYVDPKQKWPTEYELFERIISGKEVSPWILSQAPLKKVIQAKRLVVKFVRGNLLLDWFTHNHDILDPIIIIRHPCAMIASQLNKAWPVTRYRLLNHPYLCRYPDLLEKCQNLTEEEEFAALTWCLQYHAPLNSPRPYSFILITYEQLVLNGEAELKKIFDRWGEPINESIFTHLHQPSSTVSANSQVLRSANLLTGWKDHLSITQIDNILNVLKIFGMDFYNHQPEPDYTKLDMYKSNQLL